MPEACILVVEDEPLVRDLIATEMREAGYRVIEAASGVEAMARIGVHPEIDLLLTDITLGAGPDGWDVAIAFRAAWPARPVIYVSAYVPGPPRRVPTSVFFDKPYLPSQILQAVRLLLPPRPAPRLVPEAPVLPVVAEEAGDSIAIDAQPAAEPVASDAPSLPAPSPEVPAIAVISAAPDGEPEPA